MPPYFPKLSQDELDIAKLAVDGQGGAEIERWWLAEGRGYRRLTYVLRLWASRGWWDDGSRVRGGYLSEEGREHLLGEV